MNAPRRLATLPLPACLLRTPRRLTSSRSSPSGKSLPSSPIVLTASRRFAPLPLLLLTLLALAGVLLWSTPTEAQTPSRVLVSNVSQGSDDSAALSGNDHGQRFTTGSATGGYFLTSVVVVSEDAQDDDFDVEVCEADDSTGFPTSTCTELWRPDDFEAGNLEFKAPTDISAPGIRLNASDDYVVVFKQDGTEGVTLDSTTSAAEDSTGLSGWSIRNKFYWNNARTWQEKGGGNESFQVTVNGYETPANTDVTGQPVILASVDEAGILYAHTLDIRDVDGLPFTGETTGHIVFDQYTYQWIRVDSNSETNIGKESQEAPSC